MAVESDSLFGAIQVVNHGKRSEHCEAPKPSQFEDYIGYKNIQELNKSTLLSQDQQTLFISSSPLEKRMINMGNYPIDQHQLILQVFKGKQKCEGQILMSVNG